MGASPRTGRSRRLVPALTSLAVAAALLVANATEAAAAPAPVQPVTATGITADRLPTVQVDGVVWSQAVVGNTVYAGGSFANARPAGAAPGTNLTPRANLLAYDLTTGNLVTSFAPSLNGQVLSVTASPDGSRIYVGGDFTTANGFARARLAAYSTATGALITSFAPAGPTARVRAVVATSSTVYVGGGFIGVAGGSTLRGNLAAFRASDGALLPWNPNADAAVWAVAVTPDGSRVYAGGSFLNVGGRPAYGLAKVDGVTGALDTSWDAPVNNAGPNTGISSLRVFGSHLYGTSWSFGSGANLEGAFKLGLDNAAAAWVTACHGDEYSLFLTGGVVFTTGHPHYCGAMGGGFPQYPQWRFQHAMAWSDSVTGEILNDNLGYPNWHGLAPGPALVSWTPDMSIGSYTGQYQAGWSVDGNADYVVYGGEFPTVNGVGQQGLVRFARRPIAPAREGPRFTNGTFVPRLVPRSTSSVRVSWVAGYDRDSYDLTYRVLRNGTTIFTTSAGSNWWSLPALGFVDTGLTPGGTYSYQLVAGDSDGNAVFGASASVTMPTAFGAFTAYSTQVRADGARIYWPLSETSGLVVNDRAAGPDASVRVGVTDGQGDTGINWNQPGAVTGDSAAQLTDNDFSRVYALGSETAPDTFTIQTWVRSNTTRGGRIFGFGDLQNGNSAHRDRHVYMDNAGRIVFGVRAQNNQVRTIVSSSAYNNNQWHMVTATMSPAGMRLYVDGALAGSRTDTTAGEAYLGYWRLGGGSLVGWTNQPTAQNFVGWVDEVAVYDVALTQAQVQAQYALRGGGFGNQPPVASFTSSTAGLGVSVDGSGSSDPDGSVTSYAWTWGDGTPNGSGVTASHTYGASGTYSVGLTVTDNRGATSGTTRTVSVAAPGVIAADDFARTVTDGWGSADVGGTWTTTTAAANFQVAGGAGTVRVAASSGPSAYLSGVSATDVDLRTTVAVDKPGTGGGLYASLVGRRAGSNDYRLKLQMGASGTTAFLARTVGGAETVIASTVVPGLVVAAGDSLDVRLRFTGNGTTTLEGKVWRSGTTEPGSWLLTATDTTAALQAPGTVGLYAYLSGSATNSPITISAPTFSASTP